MTTAKDLLLEFTASSFRNSEKAAAMFDENGTFEMPYLEDYGVPGIYRGRKEIAGSFSFVRKLYPNFDFENVKVYIDTPDQVFAEYEFRDISSETGATIHEHTFGRLVAKDGKILLLREALNMAQLSKALRSARNQTGKKTRTDCPGTH